MLEKFVIEKQQFWILKKYTVLYLLGSKFRKVYNFSGVKRSFCTFVHDFGKIHNPLSPPLIFLWNTVLVF